MVIDKTSSGYKHLNFQSHLRNGIGAESCLHNSRAARSQRLIFLSVGGRVWGWGWGGGEGVFTVFVISVHA
jgi:hypothetical protein